MKKTLFTSIILVVLLFSLALSASADFNYSSVFYSTDGYRTSTTSATIYLQNKINNTSIYSNHFVTAVSYWNNAGLTYRTYVVNTSSSSYIYNEDFNYSSDVSIQEEGADGTVAFFEPLIQNTVYCSCHKTRSFYIALNDAEFSGLTSTYKRGVITHELGHALGLLDLDKNGTTTYQDRSIMSYASDLSSKATPYTLDVTNANECWSPHS